MPDPSAPAGAATTEGDFRTRLRADCASCFGLCCVVPAFSASADFAVDKPARTPCRNLLADFGCGIHDRLRDKGFPGCTVYDCFGAGQQVCQVTFAGADWRGAPDTAERMFTVFPVMRELHELLWYVNEALTLRAARPAHPELTAAREETERLTLLGPDALAELDVRPHWQSVNAVLSRVSELVRRGVRRPAELRGADLIGRDFHKADLRGANLRGADLSTSLFLIQSQLDAARGDGTTKLPPALARPAHWAS